MVPAMAMKLAAALATLLACTPDPPPDNAIDATVDGGTAPVQGQCEAVVRTIVTTSQRTVTTWRVAHFPNPNRAVAIRLCGRVSLDATSTTCPAGAQCSGDWLSDPSCSVVSNYDVMMDGRARVFCGYTTEFFDTAGTRTSAIGSYFTTMEVL